MAYRRKKQMNSSSYHVRMTSFDDLSIDLVKNILSRLAPDDVVRAFNVCREWRDVASSIHFPPLLLYFPSRNHTPFTVHFFSQTHQSGYLAMPNNPYDFYDYFTGKTFYLNVSHSPRGTICHARDGWILIFEHFTKQMFLFSPFADHLIRLPKLEGDFKGAAFSAPPTSSDCVVFTILETTPNSVHICTWRPLDKTWTSTTCSSHFPFDHCLYNTAVFSKGVFYCMCLSDRVGVFNPQQRTWNVLAVEPTPFLMAPVSKIDKERRQFMAEYNGNIYLVRAALDVVQPILYLLDEAKKEWVTVKTFEGATFFANSITSFIRMDMPGCIRDCICFQAISRMQCVRYSLRDKRYYPEGEFDMHELERMCSIWIDAPLGSRSTLKAYPRHN